MWRVTCLAVLLVTSQARAELVSGVPRIIDGDTFEIGPTTIRLSGIDAPEVAQPGGVDAIGALAALVEAKQTRCEGSRRDAYNRLIATCDAGEGDVGAALVLQGHAWAYTKYSPAYSDLEQAARSSHEGIWRGSPEAPWDATTRSVESVTTKTLSAAGSSVSAASCQISASPSPT